MDTRLGEVRNDVRAPELAYRGCLFPIMELMMPRILHVDVSIPASVPGQPAVGDQSERTEKLKESMRVLVTQAMGTPQFRTHRNAYEFRARGIIDPWQPAGEPRTYVLEFRYRGLRKRIQSCLASVFSLFSARERRSRERDRKYGNFLVRRYGLIAMDKHSRGIGENEAGTRKAARACLNDIINEYSEPSPQSSNSTKESQRRIRIHVESKSAPIVLKGTVLNRNVSASESVSEENSSDDAGIRWSAANKEVEANGHVIMDLGRIDSNSSSRRTMHSIEIDSD